MQLERFPRILTALCCEPWLITPAKHGVLLDIVMAHAAGGDIEAAQHAKASAFGFEAEGRSVETTGNTSIIYVEGVLGRKFSSVLNSSGVTSTDILEASIKQAADDSKIKSILLVMDTPGGYSQGIPEAAAAVNYARSQKPVGCYVDGECNSAGYWIASQCDFITAMGSGNVGCIGAYIAILNKATQYAMNGVKVQMFASGKYKGMGYPGTELTSEQQALLQSEVDSISEEFYTAVRSGRGLNFPSEIFQGQSFSSKEALEIGLIDGVGDVSDALRDVRTLENNRAWRK